MSKKRTLAEKTIMKTIHVLPLLLLLGCCKSQSLKYPGVLREKQDTAHVFIINGQSNAGSFGGGLQAQYTTSPTPVNSWDTVSKTFVPYASLSGNTEKGLQVQTAGLFAAARGLSSAYVLRISQGSQPITGWYNPGGLIQIYQDSVIAQSFRNLRAQNLFIKVHSTIWLQGEADATAGTVVATYQEKLDSVIDRFRRLDVALNNSQFVIVKLVEGSGNGTYLTPAVDIDVAFTNLAATKTNVVTIRPENIGATLIDGVHYTPTSFILIADEWYVLLNGIWLIPFFGFKRKKAKVIQMGSRRAKAA